MRFSPSVIGVFCTAIVITHVTSAPAVSCPAGWSLFNRHCYRLTEAAVRHDQLTDTCQQLGGDAVSVHSATENDIVANVAGGKYVWIGLRVTGRDTMVWEDGSPVTYSRFLPPGNRMLNERFTGAGVYQQSCRRWNFGAVSRLRYGVCRTVPGRCPDGALDTHGRCFFTASRPVAWWDAGVACLETDPHAQLANLRLQDGQLSTAITGNFVGTTPLLVQVENEFSPDYCSWTTTQYGRRTAHNCSYGCAEQYPVLCSRPKFLGGLPEPIPLMRALPPIHPTGEEAELLSSECPPGWATHGTRCVSGPTQPTSRLMADLHCQQMDARIATVRGEHSKKMLALQLRKVAEVWVVDHALAEEQYIIYLRAREGAGLTSSLTLPRYGALMATGKVIARPADVEMSAICERCRLPCSHGAVNFAGHCYQLLEGEHTLDAATRECASLGGTLVSIESLVENNFVTTLAFPASSAQCGGGQRHSQVWLGLQRISVSFSWQWPDCSEFGVQRWAAGAGVTGYCASMDAAGRWHDSDRCGQLRRLTVCEWDPCASYSSACNSSPGAVY